MSFSCSSPVEMPYNIAMFLLLLSPWKGGWGCQLYRHTEGLHGPAVCAVDKKVIKAYRDDAGSTCTEFWGCCCSTYASPMVSDKDNPSTYMLSRNYEALSDNGNLFICQLDIVSGTSLGVAMGLPAIDKSSGETHPADIPLAIVTAIVSSSDEPATWLNKANPSSSQNPLDSDW